VLELRADEPQARLVRAAALMGTGQLAAAQLDLTRLMRDMPDFADAELQLGRLYLIQKNFSKAEAVFRKYQNRSATDLRATEGLTEVYVSENQPQKALDLWRQRVVKAPHATAPRLALASLAVRIGQWHTAIEQYQELLAEDPKSSDLTFRLAQVYRSNGDTDGAIALSRRAIEFDPNNADALRFLGVLLAPTGQTQEAFAVYRRVLQLQPNDVLVLNNLAYALAETGGNLDEAFALAQRAQKLFPEQTNLVDTLGWIYLKKNMPGSAIQIFKNLVRKEPDRSTFHYHLGCSINC